MKHLTLLFCTFSFLSISCGNINGEILTQECIKKYLKDRSVKEDILEYVDNYVGSITDCESAVKTKLANLYDNLRSRLMKNIDSRPFVGCIMEDIEETDDFVSYEYIILQETAVEMISNWRFWKYFSKSSRLESLRVEAENLVTKSLLKCKGHREFGDMFTNINDHNIVWSRSGEQEHCIRKILVEKGMLKQNQYGLRDNPRNVPTSSLNCTVIFNDVVDSYYTELNKNNTYNNCFIETFRKNGYAENVLKAELLSKLQLTRSDKTKERQNFINDMVNASIDAKNC